jgi:hypothetical protein
MGGRILEQMEEGILTLQTYRIGLSGELMEMLLHLQWL